MRKLSCVLVLFMLMFFLTGCVKFNANMDIKKDKSMDFSIIYAMDTSLLEEELVEEEGKKDLEEQGFKVENYVEDNMKGIKLTRNVKNIDEVSSTEDTEYSLSGIFDTENKTGETNIFKVKKGFLKNTYIANFKFSASDSDLNSTEEDIEDETEDYIDEYEDDYLTDLDDSDDFDWSIFDTEDIESDDEDTSDSDFNLDTSELSDMTSKMDLSFNVTLPYSAVSSNATSTNNDNKELKWDLSSASDEEAIEFQFELYNMEKVYTVVGIAIVLVAVIVIVLASKGKKNNTTNVDTTEQTM